MALLFEVAFVKAGFYFLSTASVPLLDVVAFCGYKYVGISLSVLIDFVFGKLAYYAALLLSSVGMAVFIFKSFRAAAPASGAAALGGAPGGGGAANARNYFLLAAGALQLVLFWLLGHFVDYSSASATEYASAPVEAAAQQL